jgi:hypothetical protein
LGESIYASDRSPTDADAADDNAAADDVVVVIHMRVGTSWSTASAAQAVPPR